jgi:hypothetical protein
MTGITLTTGAGYWSPLVWLASLFIVLAIVHAIRSRGRKGYKHGTEQTTPFFSGNAPPRESIRPGNLYWGFFEALGRYYVWLKRAHSGVVNDYVYSFVLLLVVMLVALLIGGLL